MTKSPSAEQARPRTQAERRKETRAALLRATIECLVSYGYSQTTTARIAELAGLSRGAQLPYFRTRAELVGAAVAQLAEERAAAVHERFASGPVTVAEALDVLWAEHQGEMFDATLELWVASRTDLELRENLHQVEREVAGRIAREAVTALGETAQRPGFTEDLIFALATIRGLALLRISSGDSGRAIDALWAQARERLVPLLS